MKKFILKKIQKGFTPMELLLVIGISAVVAGLFVFTANSPSNMAALPPINVNVEAPNITINQPDVNVNVEAPRVAQIPSRAPGAMAQAVVNLTATAIIDATGGDCTLFGTWDFPTLTCTMTNDVVAPTSGNWGIEIKASGITLDGANLYTFTGSNLAGVFVQNFTDVSIINMDISGFSYANVYMECPVGAANHTISGNKIHGSGARGIYSNCGSATIENNEIYDNGGRGIESYKDNNKILANTLHGNGGAISVRGSFNTIDGNTAYDQGNGISARGSNNTIINNTINNNHYPFSTQPALFVGYGSDNVVEGNTIDNVDWGIQVLESNNTSIKDNEIYDVEWYGIYFSGANDNVTIEGNVIHDTRRGSGITVHGSTNTVVTGNTLYSNGWDGLSGGRRDLLITASSAYTSVYGNDFFSPGGVNDSGTNTTYTPGGNYYDIAVTEPPHDGTNTYDVTQTTVGATCVDAVSPFDGVIDTCTVGFIDTDGDGVPDDDDNCPLVANPLQTDTDSDDQGDACDQDDDNDTVLDGADNCPLTANTDQANFDGDSEGDVCDADDDNDTVLDGMDNCPFEDSTGLDADQDGCIDTIAGLVGKIQSFDLPNGLENSLLAKIEKEKGNIGAAINAIEALINQVEAQRQTIQNPNGKLTDAQADMLVAYANNVISTM